MRGRLSRWAWYWYRLRAMSPGETLWRAQRALSGAWGRAVWRERPQRPASWSAPAVASAAHSAAVRAAARALIPDAGAARERFRASFPGGVERARATAETLLRHRVDLFARRDVDLGDRIDWHRDYVTGRAWPRVFAGRVRVRDGEAIGEVRTVWELARHHHLTALAKAAFLTGDMRFGREVVEQWRGWIEQNPPGLGVHWTSPLEMAIRIQNWSWALAFLSGTSALDEAPLDLVLGAYQEQADAIASNLSRFSSANNHRIGEAAGLAVAGSLFPGLSGAPRWRRTGFGILEEEALRQIHPDGVGKEQAPHYLAFVIDFYALAASAAARTGEAFPSRAVAERLGLAAEFLASLGNESGGLPQIGDSDEGRAVGLFAPGDDPFAAAIREGARLSGRAADRGDVPPQEQAFWILGQETERPRERRAPAGPRVFANGGYAVFRAPGAFDAGDLVAVLDAGDLGYPALAAHGHADALAICLSIGGRWVLGDPGTFCYHAEWPWRRYFRGTSAHNTLVVDGAGSSEAEGPFLWGRRATARLVRWGEQEGSWSATGEHDGYGSLRDPVRHRRQMVCVPPGLVILVDRLEGRGEHDVSAHFHAPPEIAVTIEEAGATFAHDGRALLRIHAAVAPGSQPPSARVAKGEESPPLGWFSPRFGVRVPSPTLVCSASVAAPCTLAWLLACGPEAGARAEVRVAGDGAVSARLGAGGAARAVTIAPDGTVAAGGPGEGP